VLLIISAGRILSDASPGRQIVPGAAKPVRQKRPVLQGYSSHFHDDCVKPGAEGNAALTAKSSNLAHKAPLYAESSRFRATRNS
jgi:hypothetical protein